MPEFEELSCDVVAVSADTRGKACSFVSTWGRRMPPPASLQYASNTPALGPPDELASELLAALCLAALAATALLPTPPRWMTCAARC